MVFEGIRTFRVQLCLKVGQAPWIEAVGFLFLSIWTVKVFSASFLFWHSAVRAGSTIDMVGDCGISFWDFWKNQHVRLKILGYQGSNSQTFINKLCRRSQTKKIKKPLSLLIDLLLQKIRILLRSSETWQRPSWCWSLETAIAARDYQRLLRFRSPRHQTNFLKQNSLDVSVCT